MGTSGKGSRSRRRLIREALVVFVEEGGIVDKQHQGWWGLGDLGAVIDSWQADFAAGRRGTLGGDGGEGFVE